MAETTVVDCGSPMVPYSETQASSNFDSDSVGSLKSNPDAGSDSNSAPDAEPDCCCNEVCAGDKECVRQYVMYHYQLAKSEGFELDWSQLDPDWFNLQPVRGPLEPGEELVKELTLHAINQYNKENGFDLEFVEYDHANYNENFWGYFFYITFSARDLSWSNPEPKLYQTMVSKLNTAIKVDIFRPRPTNKEIVSVKVDPPFPMCYCDRRRRFFGPESEEVIKGWLS